MSEALASLTDQLRRWDDDAWQALTSRGLLRRARKDLQSLTPVLVSDAGPVEVQVDEWTVTIGQAGPGMAECTCGSSAACHHLVAAGLWLAARDCAPPQPDHETLQVELMALTDDELTRHAGRAGLRWATALVLDRPPTVGTASSGSVVITFDKPAAVVRYAGGGLPGLVLDPRADQAERLQVAAVLAYQQTHGRVLAQPAAPTAAGAARAAVAATRHELALGKLRSRVRQSTQRLIEDAMNIGLCHASAALGERFATLAVSAQGARYYRLALALRRAGDQVVHQVARSARSDERILLRELVFLHTLVAALALAAERGDTPERLAGSARASYHEAGPVHVIGLGGVSWRTGSGRHGVTALFWSPAQGRYLSWSDARPVAQSDYFDPFSRWWAPGPWNGLTCPAATAGNRVYLDHAKISDEGRLSGTERTTAVVSDLAASAVVEALPVVDDWGVLAGEVHRGPRSLLDPPAPLASWATVCPARFEPPWFDSTRQTLVARLRDRRGATVDLELPYGDHTRQAIARVEAWAGRPPAPGSVVVAQWRPTAGGGLIGAPLSVISANERPGVSVLAFGDEPGSADLGIASIPGVATDRGQVGAGGAEVAVQAKLPAPLGELAALVQLWAERGVGAAPPGYLEQRLAALRAAAARYGLEVFGPLPAGISPADALLRTQALIDQVTAVARPQEDRAEARWS